MAELIIFTDSNFGGLHTHIYGDTPDFTKLALGGVGSGIGGDCNDKVSSFVIVSGQWQFYKDINYGPAPLPFDRPLGPGYYKFCEERGIDNDSISSVKLVSE